MKAPSAIDTFILRFDYSTKLKFVIFISMAVVIWIAIMLLKSHGSFLQVIENQKFGLKYIQTADSLLEKLIENKLSFEILPEDPQNSEKKVFYSQLEEIDNLIKKISSLNIVAGENYLVQTPEQLQKLEFTFNAISKDWIELRKNIFQLSKDASSALHLKIIQDVAYLISFSSVIFQLTNSIDSATHRLLEILCVSIPKIQVLVPRMTLLIETEKNSQPHNYADIAHLILMNDKVKDSINNMQNNTSEALIENQALTESEWADFTNSLNKFLIPIQNFTYLVDKKIESKDTPETKVEILKLAQESLEGAFRISSNTFPVVNTLITLQTETLYNRKMLGVGFILLGLFVVSILYTTRFIRRPLEELKQAAEQLAEGNLSVRIQRRSNDEVASITDAFNKMAAFFEEVMLDANEISTRLADSATNIFNTAKKLEMNLFEQEQTINQIASNAKGVSQTVKDFAKSLEEVNKTAAITAHFAALGRTSLTEMETIMQEMKDASTNIVGTLSSLQEKVKTINDVINTIIKIADQINLLSLNTAIRASKKGLKGLGFSVVAEKIRELADQTAYATLDIEQMVQNIIEAVQEAAKEVDKFSEQIQEQVTKAMGVREGLIKLISRTQDQVSEFEKVNKGMQEQTQRAAQIHESINQLTNAAQQTTKSVRNLYLEIEYIYHATNSLQEMTKNFTKHSSHRKPGNPPIATAATSQPVNIPGFKEIKDAG